MGWPAKPWYGDAERVVGVAVVAVLLLVVLIALVVGGGSSPAGAPAPVVSAGGGAPGDNPPTTPAPAATATAISGTKPPDVQWYTGTTAVRADLADSGVLVRRHVEANDGVALEPECARLGGVVGDARAVPAAADPATVRLWSDVVDGYAGAATACGQLFDGTRIEVAVLLDRTTAALDDAEQALTALDESFSRR